MQIDTTYKTYSTEAEYIAVNSHFPSTLDLSEVRDVLDLACGTSLLTRLLLEKQPDCRVVGLDISAESLAIGRELLAGAGLLAASEAELAKRAAAGQGGVMLLEQSADDLARFAESSVDLVIMGNAIHLMPDKEKLLRGVLRVLRPGGVFAFNSVFFKGTIPKEAEALFADWMREAVIHLQTMNAERAAKGLAPIQRVRGKVGKAFDKGWLSEKEWVDLLKTTGFGPVKSELTKYGITEEGLAAIGAYKGLSEVLMSGYPADVASEALAVGAHRLFAQNPIKELPRYWLEVAASKPAV